MVRFRWICVCVQFHFILFRWFKDMSDNLKACAALGTFSLATLMLLDAEELEQEERKRKKPTWWVRPLFTMRDESGFFVKLNESLQA